MFYYFLASYKSKCCKATWKNIPLAARIGLTILAISSILILLCALLKKRNNFIAILIFIFIIDLIWLYYYIDKKEKSEPLNDKNIRVYKQQNSLYY